MARVPMKQQCVSNQARRSVVSFIAVVLLAGCAASGPRFQRFEPIATPSAQIVVYRPDMFRAGGASLNVLIDGQKVGTLRNAGWLALAVEPGTRALELNGGFASTIRPIKATINISMGERQIFRTTPGEMNNIIFLPAGPITSFGSWGFRQMSESDAAPELAELKRSE